MLLQMFREVTAINQLGDDEVVTARRLADVVDWHNIRMIKTRNRSCLRQECFFVAGLDELLKRNLDGDIAAKLFVVSTKYFAEATTSE